MTSTVREINDKRETGRISRDTNQLDRYLRNLSHQWFVADGSLHHMLAGHHFLR